MEGEEELALAVTFSEARRMSVLRKERLRRKDSIFPKEGGQKTHQFWCKPIFPTTLLFIWFTRITICLIAFNSQRASWLQQTAQQ